MNLDLDKILGGVLEWDYSVTVGGETVAVRSPSNAELIALNAAVSGGRLEPIKAAVERLLTPAVSLPGILAATIAAGVLQYSVVAFGKKARAVVEKVAAATAAELAMLAATVAA